MLLIFLISLSTLLTACISKSDTEKSSDTVMLEGREVDTVLPEQEYPEFFRKIRDSAKISGIDFHALGQEPGWTVAIDDGKIMHIAADYGDKMVIIRSPIREVNKETGEVTYSGKNDAHTAKVLIKNKVCYDGMSGFKFSATVILVLDSTTYRGCGDKL